MTLSALGRLRALPTIALALALAAALAGCSTSEPAEETPAPAPAEEPAAPKTPAEEEAEEPEPAAPAIDKSQLVTAQTTYSEELIDDPDTFEATYNDDGRLLSSDNANQHYAWTYDDAGRLLTESYTSTAEAGGESTLTTYTYDSEGVLSESLYEDNSTTLYMNPETGEIGEDSSLGEPWNEPEQSTRTKWTYSDDGKQLKSETYSLEGELLESETTYYAEDARYAYDTILGTPDCIGLTESAATPLSRETLDANGEKTGEATFTYDAQGNLTSQVVTEGGYTYTANYTYDDKGNQTSWSFATDDPEEAVSSNSTTTEWTYGADGLPVSQSEYQEGSDIPTNIFFYTYDSKGRQKTSTQAIAMESYDENGEPTGEFEYLVGCNIFTFLEDDEELTTTPEQLMANARAQVEAA